MTPKIVRDFFVTARYFWSRYPRLTVTVFLSSILLSLFELISISMIYPIITLSMGQKSEVPLFTMVEDLLTWLGLEMRLSSIVVLFVIVFVAKIITQLFVAMYVEYSRITIESDLRKSAISALERVSWRYLADAQHGIISNFIVREVTKVANIFTALQSVFVTILMLTAYGLLGGVVSPQLVVAAGVMAAILLLTARPLFALAREASKGQVTYMRRLSADLQRGLQAVKAFKAMGREKYLLASLSDATTAYADLQKMEVRSRKFMTASHDLTLLCGMLLGVYVGIHLMKMDLSQVAFVAVLLLRIYRNISDLIKKFQVLSGNQYVLKKIGRLSSELAENCEMNKGHKSPIFPSSIEFEDVCFNQDSRIILEKISFTMPPTGMTLILGPSGAGKTTLLDLLCGFYSPTSGKIRIGDDDLSSINLLIWRQFIGYVTQESNLINGSIEANVTALDQEMSRQEIERAVRQAGAWGYVSALPDGLRTTVGEAGGRVSGGERQRISIARALARRPKILILDEPTASLDPITEAEFIDMLRLLKRDVAILAVSHQPAFAEAADAVYMLDRGRLKSVGMDTQERATARQETGVAIL